MTIEMEATNDYFISPGVAQLEERSTVEFMRGHRLVTGSNPVPGTKIFSLV